MEAAIQDLTRMLEPLGLDMRTLEVDIELVGARTCGLCRQSC